METPEQYLKSVQSYTMITQCSCVSIVDLSKFRLGLSRPYPLKAIFLGPFLNTLSHVIFIPWTWITKIISAKSPSPLELLKQIPWKSLNIEAAIVKSDSVKLSGREAFWE